MAQASEDEEKHHEPTAKKLEDARRKGEIPKSTDLNTAASYGGLLLAMALAGSSMITGFSTMATQLIGQSDSLGPLFFANGNPSLAGGVMTKVAGTTLPFFALPAAAVVAMLFTQRAWTFAPDKLIPKLSRLNPISNAKNKFGRTGLFEFAKSATKLIVISVVLWMFIYGRLDEILSSLSLEPTQVSVKMMTLAQDFLIYIFVIASSIGVVDYIFQYFDHQRKNMMSQKEVTDEHKEAEGDPAMKQRRRQKAYDIATNQMLSDVPKASVIIVNPTHYAVALEWDASFSGAPICVAKGVDEVAARIREVAAEHKIPIHSDPPTARALHATVKIGDEISHDLFEPVAAAIRFAEAMRAEARKSVTE